MILGMDFLGLASKYFPSEAARDLTPKGYAIGCFDTTFGDVLPNLRVLLASGKFPVYRIQIGWADNHSIILQDQLQKRAAVYQALALEFPLVKFYLSHSCEHNEHDKTQVQKRIAAIKRIAPACIPINCPGPGVSLPNVINEYHDAEHSHNKPYFASMDGCGIGGAGAWVIGGKAWKTLHKQSKICFFWVPEWNGRKTGETSHIPPKQRKHFGTSEDIAEVVSYTRA